MIPIPAIKNLLERECTEYVTNYIHKFTNLYLKPINELNYYRENHNDIIIVQPPYKNNAGNVQYNDFSILSKSNGIDIRYEVSSLDPNSTLKGKALLHALESHIPEKLLVLVLLGRGYDEICEYTLRPLIMRDRLRITVIRTMEQYKSHIDFIFRKMR